MNPDLLFQKKFFQKYDHIGSRVDQQVQLSYNNRVCTGLKSTWI